MGRLPRPEFLIKQFRAIPPLKPVDLTGQTVLVVGANVGLGLESAKDFARMAPGKLAIACRSMKKSEDTAREIREQTGFDRISCYAVDLSVFSSVVAFAEEFERAESRLDIFMYNAGVAWRTYDKSPDGWEVSLQVNDMSCILLTVLLLPLVVKTSEMTKTADHRPRMVLVTSGTHYWITMKEEITASPNMIEKLNDESYCTQPGAMQDRYPLTKLFNVLTARELAARIPATTAIINSVSPSLCDSRLRRNMERSATFIERLLFQAQIRLFAHKCEDGCRFLTWAAIADRHRERELHGKYIYSMAVMEESDYAVSPEGYEVQRKFWDEAVEILSRVSPRFKEVVDTYLSK